MMTALHKRNSHVELQEFIEVNADKKLIEKVEQSTDFSVYFFQCSNEITVTIF